MEPKPDAAAPASQFESAYFARKLFPLVERLASEFEGEWRLQVKDVGLFFKRFAVFLETAFGRNSSERRFPKLPAHLLRDTSLNGSVHFILKTYHNYLKTHGMAQIDFGNADQKEQNLKFLMQLREALGNAGWWKPPVVFVDPTAGQSREELEAIVHSLGGHVSSAPEDPAVTHMVYPFGPDGDPDDGVQYLRALESRPGEFFVHYWYFPDSYDNWMPEDMAPENLEPDRKPIGPWKIYTRWLTDSQKFNEWMNPIDYETEEFQDEQEALQDQEEEAKTIEEEDEEEEESNGLNSDEDVDSVMTDDKTQLKRKRDALQEFLSSGPPTGEVQYSDGIRRLRSDSHRPEVDEAAAVKIAPNVTKHVPLEISKGAFSGAVENISHCVEHSEMEIDTGVETEDESDHYKQLYTVPAHASWFDWDSIHSIEREGVPVKTAEDEEGVDQEFYKKCRNAMIDRFREKPHRRFSFSDVRRKLTGSLDEMKLVYEFLAKWGLINYFPASASHSLKKTKGAADDAISVSVPSSAPPLIHFSNSVTLPEMDAAVTHGNELAFSLLNKPNKYGKTVTDASSQPGVIRCSAMPWIECTESYYHCITQPDIDLCQQAFSEGRFPSGTAAKDYIKVNAASSAKADANGWTDQETMLLLEAIEMYRDDWAEIAEHVATKSQLQCAMHWLTMSIEDDFVDELLHQEQESFQGTEEDFMKTLPFADARNPVMAQIAFLAAVVSPEVAGAAAQEALQYLAEKDLQMDGQLSSEPSAAPFPQTTSGMSKETMRRGAVAGLKSATIRARLLAEQQEREIQRHMNTVLQSQIKKIEIKLNYCAEQDKALDDERGRLQSVRHKVNAERLQFKAASIPPSSAHGTDGISSGKPLSNNGVSEEGTSNGH